MQLSHNVERLLKQRYFQPQDEEDWGKLVERVVRHVCSEEPDAFSANVYDILYNRVALPNSPCLVNAGTRNGGLFACFVVGPTEDSLEAHLDALKDIASVAKRGGGCGFTGSFIRPEGSPVAGSSHGYAYGPNAWAIRVNDYMDMLTQGGFRKMALMYTLRADHKDIERFIDLKQTKDETFAARFNQSVMAPDSFMRKAVAGEGKPAKLLEKIARNAWDNGEPGLLFSDTINNASPYKYTGQKIYATNPCWTGDTKVWTVYGPKTFKELAENGEDVPVLTQDDSGTLKVRLMRNPRKTGHRQIARIHLDDGTILRATHDHNVYLVNGEKKMVKDLQPGDRLASVYRHKANSKGYLRLSNGVENPLEHHVVVEFSEGRRPEYPKEHCHHINNDKTDNIPENLKILPARVHNGLNMIDEENPMYGVWDERNPLFGVDVSGENNPRFRHDIRTEEIVRLRDEKEMTYQAIAERLGCSKYTVMKRYKEHVGTWNHVVERVELTNEYEDVYNGTVDETHRYFVHCEENHGILSANCGEQPLPPYGSCNLGSINLAHDWFYDEQGNFDFGELAWVAGIMARFLDNVGSKNVFPNEKFARWYEENRPIGLGIMGFADALLRQEIAYGEFHSLAFLREAMKTTYTAARETSEYLGQERGVPVQCEKLPAPRRNITLTSIAPTGSIGFLAETSHSIEPIFSPTYQRTDERGETYTFTHPLADKPFFRSALNPDQSKVPTWEQHVNVQIAVQAFVDSGVSKTINFPKNATVMDVYDALVYAWERGAKGITVYRNGSRETQVLEEVKEEDSKVLDCPSGVCEI